MWKYCLLVSALTVTVLGGQTYALPDEKSLSPNPEGYYHYPAPPKSQQIAQPQAQIRQFPQTAAVQTYQNQYQFFNAQQQHQQQQQAQPQQQQSYQQYQQQQQQQPRFYPQQIVSPQFGYNYPSAVVNQQFASPALENAAFNMVLTNQGYKTTGNALPNSSSAAPTSAALKAIGATSSASSANVATTPAQLALLSASPATSPNSLNVKLPLPFNITPLNIAPLPLQAGAPYSKLPKGVTSYGTVYPQRRR